MLGSQRFGRGARNPLSVPPGTSIKQPGFLSFEATWLTSLLLPMPNDAESFSDCATATRIVSAISRAGFFFWDRRSK